MVRALGVVEPGVVQDGRGPLVPYRSRAERPVMRAGLLGVLVSPDGVDPPFEVPGVSWTVVERVLF